MQLITLFGNDAIKFHLFWNDEKNQTAEGVWKPRYKYVRTVQSLSWLSAL